MKRMLGLLLGALAVGAMPGHAAVLRAFATSTVGTGNLHSWDEVKDTALTGLAAADGICQVRAAAARLPEPARYVAWLSDRDDDAYCRVFGLSGKIGDRCGQESLPVGSGPWRRVDGVPFADRIESALADNLVYSTLNIDESGEPLSGPDESFTATGIDGAFNTEITADCDRWTSAVQSSETPALGSNLASGGYWSFDDHGRSCDQPEHLICLQKGPGSPLDGLGAAGHREAFVSSLDLTGALEGVEGADALCQSLAASAHLYQPEAFKALLASSTFSLDLTERIQFDGPWYRRDGLLFAHDKAELTGGAITLPLNVTETGTYLGTAVALTGATAVGTPQPGFDCGAWGVAPGASHATAALVNTVALTGTGGARWLDAAEVPCTAPSELSRRLFCLSDSDLIFHDEFDESPVSP